MAQNAVIITFFMILFLSYPSIVLGDHSTLRNDTFNTLPDANASFRTQSQAIWDHEGAQREERYLARFTYSGGIHGISSSTTSAPFTTEAFVPERLDQASTAIDYSNGGNPGGCLANDIAWVIISSDNNGIAGWTRVGTTAYYYLCEGDTTPNQPSLSANSTFLMRV